MTFRWKPMRAGDIWILNDTYMGGTHLPDIAIMMPVFAGGEPVAISAAMTHHQDVGGMAPGSTPTNATEIFQEGIRIPLLKFFDQGTPNETLVAMLRRNVRLPDILMGDINAQVAACHIGARRLAELAAAQGTETATFDHSGAARPCGDDESRGAAPASRRHLSTRRPDGQ